jgi:hypothetical protein
MIVKSIPRIFRDGVEKEQKEEKAKEREKCPFSSISYTEKI